MESTQLLEFYRTLSHWPTTDSELNSVAEKIGKLLHSPFAAIITTDQGSEKVGLSFAESAVSLSGGRSPELFAELIRRTIRQAESGATPVTLANTPANGSASGAAGSSGSPSASPSASKERQLKQIQVSGDLLAGYFLTFAPLLTVSSGEQETGGATSTIVNGRRPRRSMGWIVAAMPKPLTVKEELLFIAAAEKLSEAAEVSQFEAAIGLRSQFLSIASHELKTPLTSIYGMLQLQERMLRLRKDDPKAMDQEKQQFFLKKVIRQVERLNELIDGLLDVSRIQNGRFMVEPSDADLGVLIRETLSTRLEMIAQEAGVKLNLDAPESLIAYVDPVRMEEVITNLIMNAIRFSPEGGVIWVRLRDDGGAFRLTIRDQGPSVPIEDRERIFQPFERAARTSRMGGLGLGLFISRQIAQLHGGNVSLVESVPGKGNVFEAHFPLRASNLSVASA